jgi:MYXO-CTERM domain-containing protein
MTFRNVWRFLPAFAAAVLSSTAHAERVPLSNVIERAERRNQPSLFRVWSGDLKNIPGKADPALAPSDLELLARHDLTVQGPWFFKLEWQMPASGFLGDAVAFTPASIQAALQIRQQLLALNPNIIIIGEVRNYDAPLDYLPANSPYWYLQNGQKVLSGGGEGLYRLDANLPAFQKHVGDQAVALMDSGVFDGVFLDWAKDERFGIVKAVRDALGDNAVIMGNVNIADTPMITPLMNAVFMESIASFFQPQAFWSGYHRTIDLNHKGLREPKLVGAELWGDHENNMTPVLQQENHMRAGFTAVLTSSDGFYAYYPDGDGYFDHQQHFYDFWNAELGKPLGEARVVNGAYVRDFTAGTALYNPIGNQPVTIQFDRPHKSMRTGQMGTSHETPPYDGDIFVNDTPVPSETPGGGAGGGGAGGGGGPLAGQAGAVSNGGTGVGGSGLGGVPGSAGIGMAGSAMASGAIGGSQVGGSAPAGGLGASQTAQEAPGGCSCRAGNQSGRGTIWLGLLAMAALVARRERLSLFRAHE